MNKNLNILRRIADWILILAYIIVTFIGLKLTYIGIIVYEIIIIIAGIIAIYLDLKISQKANNKENNK
jgi:ABC-type bacteriocin/lantibiotic exporter with double-glycine peptidase domain